MSSLSQENALRQPTLPEATIAIPKGKYYPSNYKIIPVTSSSSPTSVAAAATNLSMPSASSPKRLPTSKHHKRKLQQYQRDMIAQARLASTSTTASGSGMDPTVLVAKPISPRLHPMRIPDDLSAVMTPLELGSSTGAVGGYLEARGLGPG